MSDTPQASRPVGGVDALVSVSAGMSPCADYATRLASAARERGRVELTAEWILSVFDSFYAEFLKLTWAAKAAFQSRDHPTSIANARRRLGLYNATVYPLADALRDAFPKLTGGRTESLRDGTRRLLPQTRRLPRGPAGAQGYGAETSCHCPAELRRGRPRRSRAARGATRS